VTHPETYSDPDALGREDALVTSLARHGIVCEDARLKEMAHAMQYLERMTQRLYVMRGVSDELPEPMRGSARI
jgi:ribulose-5-phosphate 4-epimerase/fuculose-1-phosphate aldolase